VLNSWLFTLEFDVAATDPELAGRGQDAVNQAVEELLERRLAAVSVLPRPSPRPCAATGRR
jgi:hypothetical protein